MVEGLLALLSVGAAGIPMVGFLVIMVLLDRYDREPWWLVAVTMAWGALGAVVVGVTGSLVLSVPVAFLASPEAADLAGIAFIAPLAEEPAKALILIFIAMSRHFDNATDGFVYGAAAGLGFGMTENLMYFVGAAVEGSVGAWIGVVVVRTLFTAMMHACATSVVGAAIGWTRFRPWSWKLVAVPIGLMIAMGIHFLWNGPLALASVVESGGWLASVAYLLFPLEFLLLFAVYQVCLWQESQMIRRELTLEANAGTLPAEHVEPMGSWWRRLRSSGWLPEGVDAGEYLRAATRLAFSRDHLRLRPGDDVSAREADDARARIKTLLTDSGS